MKVLVISDIHGSSYYAKKIKEINGELPKLKKEIDLCNEINVESISIKEKIEGLEKENQKERNE